MRVLLLCVISFILLLQCLFAQENSMPARFILKEEDGFIRLKTNNNILYGEKITVTAQIGEVVVSVDSNNCFSLIGANKKHEKVGYVSVLAVDMCIDYYEKAKINYILPLKEKDLISFCRKAKWTIKK